MNIYFLVEGEAELGVYPAWIDYLFESKLKRSLAYDIVSENEYFIFNGGGIGKMVHHSIRDAIQEIAAHPVYDWFVIVVDTDDQTVNDRLTRIETAFTNPTNTELPVNCNRKIILQSRCFETWLCGNMEAFALAQISTNKNVKRFITFYDLTVNDPELMLKDPDKRFEQLTLSKFHSIYLHHLLLPKKYNKGSAHVLINVSYLKKLQERLLHTPTHLITFNEMLSFFQILKLQL